MKHLRTISIFGLMALGLFQMVYGLLDHEQVYTELFWFLGSGLCTIYLGLLNLIAFRIFQNPKSYGLIFGANLLFLVFIIPFGPVTALPQTAMSAVLVLPLNISCAFKLKII